MPTDEELIEDSIVRRNMLTEPGYAPYCGSVTCTSMRRAPFNGTQFKCHFCGWVSELPANFIQRYKEKWGK